ncbi:LysR family transcriptional regulator [Brachybacterium phenoliresistens]|uniref:LysR family transcriptional regulator n=1 Tax=Brachybacterium phenoliresistens TaxID=396014 RepID=UPI0004BCC8E1|nr:LysR family transcriptional regulator [Brachybacterium phenoliresistens]
MLETRELTYFLAVAEELHFGRAAGRLGIAQPPLSRAIRRLESQLDAQLFERTSRSVALTPAGRVLREEAGSALTALEAAERRTRRTARALAERPSVALATKAGASVDLLTDLLDRYAAADGARVEDVDVLLCGIGEQEQMLRDGRADLALLHLPFDSVEGLDYEEILVEPQVLVLPRRHPAAEAPELSLAEASALEDLPLARFPRGNGGHDPGPGPTFTDHVQLMQLIRMGRAAVVLPASVRTQLDPSLACVPVPDAPAVTTVLAWPPHSRSRTVAALVRAAVRLAEEHASIAPAVAPA